MATGRINQVADEKFGFGGEWWLDRLSSAPALFDIVAKLKLQKRDGFYPSDFFSRSVLL